MISVLLHNGSGLHFLEETEVVVAGSAVCAQADVYVRLHHSIERSDSGGQLEVTNCAAHHIGFPFCQEAAVLRREPDAVHGCQALAKHSQRVQILHRALALGHQKAIHLLAGLGEVDVNHGIMPVGDLLGFLQRLLGAGVGGMGAHGRGDQLIALPAADEGLHLTQKLGLHIKDHAGDEGA